MLLAVASLPLQRAPTSALQMTLARTLASDVISGTLSVALSAPLVCTMDRAMTLNAAGRQSLPAACREDLSNIARRPIAFVRSTPFLWIWFAYGITYIVANVLSTVAVPVAMQLLVTTGVNTAVCIAKDAKFTVLYGKNEDDDQRPLPPSSFGCFLARDIATMGFVFTLPSLIIRAAPRLPELTCRFATPLLCQYITTPLYLLGLAFYNLPGSPLREKIATVRRDYLPTVTTRQIRAIAQYSLTSVANSRLRVVLAG